jgi:sensor domain CHASE-containing protein
MILRYRLILVLIIAVVAYSLLDFLVDRNAVAPKFNKLEQDYAAADLERGVNALQRELHHLELFTHDWSAWDDTYDFMESRNPNYIAANFVNETFTDNSINVMYVCRLDGEVLYGKVMDLSTGHFIDLPELPEDRLPAGSPFLLDPGDNKGKTGIVVLQHGVLAVAMMPVLTTYSAGPSRGVLIFGRFIDDKFVQELIAQTKVKLGIYPLAVAAAMPGLAQAAASDERTRPYYQKQLTDEEQLVSTVIPDLNGQPALLVTAKVPRVVHLEGEKALEDAALSNILVSLLILSLLLMVMDRTFGKRVMQLQHSVGELARTGDITARLTVDGDDEVARLGRQINTMLASIEQMERSRAAAASQAAELEELRSTAAGIAHEINNPLAGLLGITQILLDESIDTPDFRGLLNDMTEAAVRIREILRKMEEVTDYRVKPVGGNLAILGLEKEPGALGPGTHVAGAADHMDEGNRPPGDKTI